MTCYCKDCKRILDVKSYCRNVNGNPANVILSCFKHGTIIIDIDIFGFKAFGTELNLYLKCTKDD